MSKKMKEPDILKDVFGGLKQTKQYVIGEIESWGSPTLDAGRIWNDAVKAGRIKKTDSMGLELYVLDGKNEKPAKKSADASVLQAKLRVLKLRAKMLSLKAEWDESKHPRDDDGKWGKGGGSGSIGFTSENSDDFRKEINSLRKIADDLGNRYGIGTHISRTLDADTMIKAELIAFHLKNNDKYASERSKLLKSVQKLKDTRNRITDADRKKYGKNQHKNPEIFTRMPKDSQELPTGALAPFISTYNSETSYMNGAAFVDGSLDDILDAQNDFYANSWLRTGHAFRAVKRDAFEYMLNTRSMDVNDTDNPVAVTAFAGRADEGYGNFMLIIPKDKITLKHHGDLEYPDEVGAKNRLNQNVEARVPPHHQIPEGTILVVRGNDKLDKAFMQQIKDSGLFKDVVEGTWQ